MLNSLSGRFLILTTIFVMLAEVLIFVPSIARFREDYLLTRLERAQIASLALLANDMIDAELEAELLENADVLNVVLRRDQVRQLMLSSPMLQPISDTFDLRETSAVTLIGEALTRLTTPENEVIRVIGAPVRDAGLLIEVTMETMPLRAAMLDYGVRILILSAVISIITAGLLFFAVRRLLVHPIKGVVGYMQSYAAAPEDARRIIKPSAGVTELREAEEATDRIESSEDPLVRRMAPKLVNSIARAVHLCESTLAFGKAEEPAPRLSMVLLSEVVADVIDSERLAVDGHDVSFSEDIAMGLSVRADADQLFRVISNLVRNARQAIVATGKPGEICVHAHETDTHWCVEVADTGPGLPPKAQEHLFTPFQGGMTKGGTGLGLAIAAELIRGHGGWLELLRTGADGTAFQIHLPKADAAL